MDEGTDVASAIFPPDAHERKARKGILPGRAQQEISLVVSKLHIVAWPVFLDELLLQEEGFLLVAYLKVIEVLNSGDERPRFAVFKRDTRGREIIGQPLVQIFRLADIDDPSPAAPHQIHSGTMRGVAPLFPCLVACHALETSTEDEKGQEEAESRPRLSLELGMKSVTLSLWQWKKGKIRLLCEAVSLTNRPKMLHARRWGDFMQELYTSF